MRRALLRVSALVASLACAALGAAAPVVTADELFKWGEFDSLIRALEPITGTPGYAEKAADRADSAERARSLLYLGVAYSAKGREGKADTAFRSACALDSALELDPFYVIPAIHQRFLAVKEERIRLGRQRAAAAARPGPGVSAPAGPVLREDRSWVWWGLGTAAFMAASGGAYWYIARQPSGPREEVTIVNARGEE
jgi:hypothetical protein